MVPAVGSHAGKLNLLAAVIGAEASADDLIMFLDGDAFPIADPMRMVREALERTALVAIRRDENGGDKQPHPSFCVTSVATWRSLNGDWSEGYPWTDGRGDVTSDVGGNLLLLLELSETAWEPLLRSNTVDLHPVWFGVYGGVVYHHGSGFRPRISRADAAKRPRRSTPNAPGLRRLVPKLNSSLDRRWEKRTQARWQPVSERIYGQLVTDPQFFHQFLAVSNTKEKRMTVPSRRCS